MREQLRSLAGRFGLKRYDRRLRIRSSRTASSEAPRAANPGVISTEEIFPQNAKNSRSICSVTVADKLDTLTADMDLDRKSGPGPNLRMGMASVGKTRQASAWRRSWTASRRPAAKLQPAASSKAKLLFHDAVDGLLALCICTRGLGLHLQPWEGLQSAILCSSTHNYSKHELILKKRQLLAHTATPPSFPTPGAANFGRRPSIGFWS